MTPLAFTDDQLAEILRRARLIPDDDARDAYFAAVADTLRDMPTVDDLAVHRAAAAAFAPFNPQRDASR